MLRRLTLVALLLTFAPVAGFAVGFAQSPQPRTVMATPVAQPLVFTANEGQWPAEILYRSTAPGAVMWFSRDSVYFQFDERAGAAKRGADRVVRATEADDPPTVVDSLTDVNGSAEPARVLLVKLTFAGASPAATIETGRPVDWKCHFFLGNDPAAWRRNVRSYESLTFRNLYPGIDLRYYGARAGAQQTVEYDVIAQPGADLSRVKMRVQWADRIEVGSNGELALVTAAGTVIHTQPVAYQNVARGRQDVHTIFVHNDDGTFGFSAPRGYDRRLPLTVDPLIKFATYLGGSSTDEGHAVDVDSSGNAYVAGLTNSSNFPTASPFDGTANGSSDVFLTKFTTAGNALVYSTYIGGTGADFARDVDEGGFGEVSIAGSTTSTNFPTSNAFDSTLGGSKDAFLCRVVSNGSGLLISTYIGGSGTEDAFGVFADGQDLDDYVTGFTTSTDFPTVSAYDSSANGGNDGFVVRVGSLGGLEFGTYLGGSGNETPWEITVDSSNNSYVTGLTTSTNFPTLNAWDFSANGSNDVFVTKLNSSGNALVYSTYLGAAGDDQGLGIAVDSAGAAYVTGLTNSTAFPTYSAFSSTHNGLYDCFVTKFMPSGSGITYSTYLGGAGNEYGYAIAVDQAGRAVVVGRTSSDPFPRVNPADSTYGGAIDAFVSRFTISGAALTYSSYIGGSGEELGLGVAIDSSCYVYAAGYTKSSDFPTSNAYDNTLGGTQDAFLVKTAAYTCGDVNGDGHVDVGDIVALNGYVLEGPPPCPIDAADVNGDGVINAADVDYLANAVVGGPAPVCP